MTGIGQSDVDTKEPSNLPTVKPDLVDVFDEHGAPRPPSFDRLQPIIGSEQSGIAGEEGDVRKTDYVGHVAYSPDFNTLVYQAEREQHLLLQKVPGKGFSISEHIIETLRNDYGAEYVFGGMRESKNVLVIPVEKFDEEWKTEDWDDQLYATVASDVLYELPNAMPDVFTDMPSESDNAITLEEAIERL